MDISRAKAMSRSRARKRRVGRGTGSRRGKTCGRGQDGARSRSGWSSRGISGGGVPLWRRLPKRGFSNAPFRHDYEIVNVGRLECFPDGATVTREDLRRRGIIKQDSGKGVKILGEGELTRALAVHADAFSGSAAAKIEAAGGSVELVPPPAPPVRNKMRSASTPAGIEGAAE